MHNSPVSAFRFNETSALQATGVKSLKIAADQKNRNDRIVVKRVLNLHNSPARVFFIFEMRISDSLWLREAILRGFV